MHRDRETQDARQRRQGVDLGHRRPGDLPEGDNRGEKAGAEEDLDGPLTSCDARAPPVSGHSDASLLGGVWIERHDVCPTESAAQRAD